MMLSIDLLRILFMLVSFMAVIMNVIVIALLLALDGRLSKIEKQIGQG